MNDIALHRSVLVRLLSDIFKHPVLASQLGFKGGTCLYLLHQLPRFSTDLDFTLLAKDEFDAGAMHAIVERALQVQDHYDKHYTWFWKGNYDKEGWAIKVEISKRQLADQYDMQNLFGLPIRCLTLPCMLAQKLCAITGRKTLANRDLFDCHFLLKQGTRIHMQTVQECTGLGIADYIAKLVEFVPAHISSRGVLDGLGELLEPGLNEWARENLVEELLFYLRSYAVGGSKEERRL